MNTRAQFGSGMSLFRLSTAAFFLATALLLTACGDNDSKPQGSASDVVAGVAVAGATPFISFVPLSGQSLKHVVTYRYAITPKNGSVSKPVGVTYAAAALKRRGHYVEAGSSANLPVFGLYSGYANQVRLELTFDDGSQQQMTLNISTPSYVSANGIFDQPTIIKKRSGPGELDFFYVKSGATGPVVLDSDGDIRWIGPSAQFTHSVIFDANAFVIGSSDSVGLSRIELDGKISRTVLSPSGYTHFHHNFDSGKVGVLGEVDGVSLGAASVESVLLEFSPAGTMLKEWDFADIIGRYMRSQGDDPSPFIRPGFDWFHINAATYDARDDSIIASSRENFVVKVDYKTGDIRWILGDPTKYWHTFASLRAKALVLEAGGHYPLGQHATSIDSRGNLMLFNNGAPSFNQPAGAPVGETRAFSEMSSYAIDPIRMTAREASHFDYGKSILSDICSSAAEAKGGTILLSFATANNRTRARLVGLDAERNVLFDFEYKSNACATAWNAQPIAFDALIFSN